MPTLWLTLLACQHQVPSHLLPPSQRTGQTELPPVETVDDALRVLLNGDPLARTPRMPPREELDALGSPSLTAYTGLVRELEQGASSAELSLQQLENAWRGTVAVPLGRGYRVRVVENQLASEPERTEATDARLLALLTPLARPAEESGLPRLPMEWAVGDGDLRKRSLELADTWVLTGWLDAPDIPLGPTSKALDGLPFDGLKESALGELIQARAAGASAESDAGMTHLREATELALFRVAADRDKEQGEWAATLAEARGATGSDDPILFHLQAARTALTPAAGDDDAAAGALLAIHASRWVETCPQPRCRSLDRTDALHAVTRWPGEAAVLAQVWQVIALKQALDTMETAHDTVLFPVALADLLDALIGTGGGPFPGELVRYRSASPSVWLLLGRSVGAEATTEWGLAKAALRAHLANQADRAREAVSAHEGLAKSESLDHWLEKTAKRARR